MGTEAREKARDARRDVGRGHRRHGAQLFGKTEELKRPRLAHARALYPAKYYAYLRITIKIRIIVFLFILILFLKEGLVFFG